MFKIARILPALFLVLSLGACGDDDSGSGDDGPLIRDEFLGLTACGNNGFTACGGELEGSWRAVSQCGLAPNTVDANCDGLEYQTTAVDDLVVTFGPGGAFSSSATGTISAELSMSQACADAAGGTCESLNDEFLNLSESGGRCVEASTDQIEGISGSYRARGGRLTISSDGEEGDETEFCVRGDTLTVRIPDMLVYRGFLIATYTRVQ